VLLLVPVVPYGKDNCLAAGVQPQTGFVARVDKARYQQPWVPLEKQNDFE